MNRLFIIILALLSLSLKSDGETIERQNCDWTGVPVDKYGCVDFGWVILAEKHECANLPKCFKLQIEEVEKEKPKKKEYFSSENSEERKKIIPILDNSAVALLKNSNLKNIKIIFYNKGKLSKNFQSEAEGYLLEKGVKRDQFIIEIRN
jgi:hypothetical protein